MPDLDEIIVTGGANSPGNAPSYEDWANLLNRFATPDLSGGADAFAPPPPVLLPDFIVAPPPPPPATIPIPPAVITPILTSVGAGIVGVLFPQPIGGGDLPDNATQWRPPDEPPGAAPPAGGDAPQPPDWDALSEGFDVWGDRLSRGADVLRDAWNAARKYLDLFDDLLFSQPPVSGSSSSRSVQRISDFPLLDEFVVSPPKPKTRTTTRTNPSVEVPLYDYRELFGVGSDFGFGFEPSPNSPARSNPVPGRPERVLDPGRRTGLQPRSTLAPDLFGAPSPAPGNPLFFDPIATSPLPAPPRGSPARPGAPLPIDALPVDDLATPFADPLASFDPLKLPPKKDACDCDGGGGKKKKKKKRKERDVCFRGTYRQLRKGISYRRLEEVPCTTAKESRAAPKKPRKPKVSPDLKDYSPF